MFMAQVSGLGFRSQDVGVGLGLSLIEALPFDLLMYKSTSRPHGQEK